MLQEQKSGREAQAVSSASSSGTAVQEMALHNGAKHWDPELRSAAEHSALQRPGGMLPEVLQVFCAPPSPQCWIISGLGAWRRRNSTGEQRCLCSHAAPRARGAAGLTALTALNSLQTHGQAQDTH